MVNCDFSGYATRNDLLCGDGRTIRKDAFKENDGCEVPLVWNHEHNDPNAVLGHAVLENREDGVYAYGVFNDTEQGQTAKKLVQNGDVRSLSIWANQLKHIGKDVIHGNIRELSHCTGWSKSRCLRGFCYGCIAQTVKKSLRHLGMRTLCSITRPM